MPNLVEPPCKFEIYSIKAAAKIAATADPATADSVQVEAELEIGETAGAAAMDGGEAAPEETRPESRQLVELEGDANGESDGEDAVVGAFAGAETGGVDIVGGGGVAATGAGEAAGDAPGACAKADPATNDNIRAMITFEYAIIV
ncbi:hypothetical protein HAX54_043171 [Datura stramonium]|uniref:Uncharacterized protein n=1 Tax=Datura stramonium TaxID=4076 RepID=A0ABS8W1Z5_DATST|nr:hypothetical protein [Datura stramonium]